MSCAYGQEDCANGIDDDGDGLIDLLDNDCDCSGGSFGSNILPNASFEDSLCCPSGNSQMNCVNHWVNGNWGTSDYFHTCGQTNLPSSYNAPPFPVPFGEGYVGFWNTSNQGGRKEYVGMCLPSALVAGNSYKLTVFLAAAEPSTTSSQVTIADMEFAIFGHTSCDSLPFTQNYCPLASNTQGWDIIDSVYVTGDPNWNQYVLEFTASQNYSAIVLGPSCDAPTAVSYYFLDNMELLPDTSTLDLTFDYDTCNQTAIIQSDVPVGAQVAWFENGVALTGETSETLEISAMNSRSIQSMVWDASGCIISDTLDILPIGHDVFTIEEIANNTFVVSPQTDVISWEVNGEVYFEDTLFLSDLEGNYLIELNFLDEHSCDERTRKTFYFSNDTSSNSGVIEPNIYIANSFTPNGDDNNDFFGPVFTEGLEYWNLKIYNRWGKEIFEGSSENLPQAFWDGTYQGMNCPETMYVFRLEWKKPEGSVDYSVGRLMLIR